MREIGKKQEKTYSIETKTSKVSVAMRIKSRILLLYLPWNFISAEALINTAKCCGISINPRSISNHHWKLTVRVIPSLVVIYSMKVVKNLWISVVLDTAVNHWKSNY